MTPMDALRESLYQAGLRQLQADALQPAWSDRSLSAAGLPARAVNALTRGWKRYSDGHVETVPIHTCDEVATTPDLELGRYRDMGKLTLRKVREIVPYRGEQRRQYRDAI